MWAPIHDRRSTFRSTRRRKNTLAGDRTLSDHRTPEAALVTARILTFLALFSIALCAAAARAATTPIELGTRTGVRDLGPAPASLAIRVAVVLNYHHDDDLEWLTQAQADPASPYFHRFLTPAQFDAYFAPTADEYARVLASLERGGFRVLNVYPNRTVVDAVAPAPIAERYFRTDIHVVRTADGETTYTNVNPGLVPADIGDVVYHVVGLDAAGRMRPMLVPSLRAGRHLQAPAVSPVAKPIFGPDGGYGPRVFERSYVFPSEQGITGTGRASGVATDADFLDSDLKAFVTYFQIKRSGTTRRVLVDGGPPKGDGPDSDETTLDVEQIATLAPGTELYVYEVTYDEPTNANFIDIYNQAVSDDKIDTLNTSYGYCETAIHTGYPESVNHVFRQGNALGITFHAASGDGGAYWQGCTQIAVSAPVDAPHNTGIGGTTLSVDSNGGETAEVGWSGSGGGVSVLFKVPSYQQHVKHVLSSGRNVPDLAFDADPGTGASYYYGGGWDGPIGGTSQASPIFGAALTEIDQTLDSRAGDFNVTLYKTWLAHGYGHGTGAYFRDITQGNNGYYDAGPGYDQMSGIGVMRVEPFAGLLR
jgi:subtilase family serine protease